MKLETFLPNLYIFILVLVITIILYTVYLVLQVDRPNDLTMFNQLEPFPTIKMKGLPDPKFTMAQNVQNCRDHLIPCNDDTNCSEKCGDDYTCRVVSEGENIIYNNIKVGKGKWCLPKNTLQGCGKYTGRSVWSANEQGQGWKCECLYPSLFDGPYCLNNKSCQDPTPGAKNIQGNNNALVDSQGNVYDPSLPDFKPPNGIYNPFAVDSKGNRVYSCRCGVGSGGKRFIKLQNDPYYCHLEPCTQTNTSPLWDELNQTCLCGTDALKNSDGTCVQQTCSFGSWNGITQQCECAGTEAKIRCNSDFSKWNDSKSLPMCSDPKNQAGIECISRCIRQSCTSDNDNDCGGKNGYKPKYCNDSGKKCIVCISGNCIDENGSFCCECGEGETYENISGTCLGSGRTKGRVCYDKSCGNMKFFWIMESLHEEVGNRYRVAPIVYSKSICPDDDCVSTKTLPGWSINRKGDISFADAQDKCKIRCLSEKGIYNYNDLENVLNYLDKAGDNDRYLASLLENIKSEWDKDFWRKYVNFGGDDIMNDFIKNNQGSSFDNDNARDFADSHYDKNSGVWKGNYYMYGSGIICSGMGSDDDPSNGYGNDDNCV